MALDNAHDAKIPSTETFSAEMSFTETPLRHYLAEAESIFQDFLGPVQPIAGLILGSGLNHYADTLENTTVLPYAEVPHVKVSSATGHKGQFVLGQIPAKRVIAGAHATTAESVASATGDAFESSAAISTIATDRTSSQPWILCMQGRLHGYEGCTAREVAFPVWLMHQAGIQTLVTTNAVGAINPAFKVGSFCAISDHINFTGRNPLVGLEPNAMAERFVPMLSAYDPQLRALLKEAAQQTSVTVNEGVYLGLLGPSFETPAEINMFAAWGADTVAMSVVEEVIAARHVSMRVAGLSLVSNMACGVSGGDPSSEEVEQVAQTVEQDFTALMNYFFTHLPE